MRTDVRWAEARRRASLALLECGRAPGQPGGVKRLASRLRWSRQYTYRAAQGEGVVGRFEDVLMRLVHADTSPLPLLAALRTRVASEMARRIGAGELRIRIGAASRDVAGSYGPLMVAVHAVSAGAPQSLDDLVGTGSRAIRDLDELITAAEALRRMPR